MDVEPRFKQPRAKRSSRAELRDLRRALLERSLGHCEAKGFSPLCTTVGVHIHHAVRRSQGGRNTLDDTLFICAPCHDRIHAAPAEALIAGLLRPGWAK